MDHAPFEKLYLSNEKRAPCCSGFVGDDTTQLFGDYFINHYKDPY